MRRVFPLLALLATACGLAENEQDEKNKHIYLTISDSAFAAYCLAEFDSNGDGQLSRYEAQRVRRIDCSGRGIETLYEIGEFSNLEELDCSSNRISTLDLSRCRNLTGVVCPGNALVALDLTELRSLAELNCAENRLTALDLRTTSSLRVLVCNDNDLRSLDIGACASVMERVDARSNESMTRLWVSSAQTVRDLKTDPQTVVERR